MKHHPLRQFIACATSFLEIPIEDIEKLYFGFKNDLQSQILGWYKHFYSDLYLSKYGYPITEASNEPYTEYFIEKVLNKEGVLKNCTLKTQVPSLYLTHDIDNLNLSLRLRIKESISQKRIILNSHISFLHSIETLLQIDEKIAGYKGASTVFVAYPQYSKNPMRWPLQWIIDPLYKEGHPYFSHLIELLKKYKCTIGLHGSFFSLSDHYIHKEKEGLEKLLDAKIYISRQHWLNLPRNDSFEILLKSGFQIDGTLGWNGFCGFRGGMARPFPIILEDERTICAIPLTIMDGPLINAIKIDKNKALDQAKKLIRNVFERQGSVAVNWHDRAAHPLYKWDEVYMELLEFAKNMGFNFRPMSNI
jgi:hypothetical protein